MGSISTSDGSPVPNFLTQLLFDRDFIDPVTMVYDAGRSVIRSACKINAHTQRMCNQIEPIIPDFLKKKNALVLATNYDHNNALTLSFSDNALNLTVFYQIQHYYDVKYKKVSNISSLCRAVDEHTKNSGPIDLLIIRAHGSQEKIDLGRTESFEVGNPLPTKSCLQNLSAGSSIILDSCSTGRGRESECNLANYIAAQSPKGVRVFSAVDKSIGFIMTKAVPIEVKFVNLKLSNFFRPENLTYTIDSTNVKAAISTIGLDVEIEGLETRGGWCRSQILESIPLERDVFNDEYPCFKSSHKRSDLKERRLTFSRAMRTDASMTTFANLRTAAWGEETNPLASSLQALQTIQSHARRKGAKSLFLQFYPPNRDNAQEAPLFYTTQRFQEIRRNKGFQTSRLNSTNVRTVGRRVLPFVQKMETFEATLLTTSEMPLPTNASEALPEPQVTEYDVTDIGQHILNFTGEVSGVKPAYEELKQLNEILQCLATDPSKAPIKVIAQLLRQPESMISNILNKPQFIGENLKQFISPTANVMGAMSAVFSLLVFMDSVSWVAEFMQDPTKTATNMIKMPYTLVKGVVDLGVSFIRNPGKTAELLFKNLIKSPERSVSRFLRAIKLKKRKRRKQESIAIDPLQQQREVQKYVNDLTSLYCLARAKGFIDPYKTIDEYHHDLMEDWKKSDTSYSYLTFPQWIIQAMASNSIEIVWRLSPRAHPYQEIISPEVLLAAEAQEKERVQLQETFERLEVACQELQESTQQLSKEQQRLGNATNELKDILTQNSDKLKQALREKMLLRGN